MNAVKIVFPSCEHRYCKRHLLQNMAVKGYRGQQYKNYVDDVVYATTQWDYNKAMEAIKKFNEKAWEYIRDIGKEHFSRHAFSPKAKTDLVVNNLSEVFNKYIIEARDKPIVTMCEYIRRKVMTRIAEKRDGVANAHWDITPIVAQKLEMEKKYARYCRVYRSGFHLWEVHSTDRSYEVNINARTCGCYSWQLTGIPCKHAISAIYQEKQLPEQYVHEYYKKEAYLRTYSHMVYPVPKEHGWTRTDSPDINPPRFRKQAGRPKKSRRRSAGEEPTRASARARMNTVTCSNCKLHNHTYRTCGKQLRPDLQLRLKNLKVKRSSF